LGCIALKVLPTLLARFKAVDWDIAIRVMKEDRCCPYVSSNVEDTSGLEMLKGKEEIVLSLEDLEEVPLLIPAIVK
jgi:hypothetical protein